MTVKLVTWDDDRTKREVSKRFRNAVESRSYLEDHWLKNEGAVFSTSRNGLPYIQPNLEANFSAGLPGVDNSNTDANVAYTFKNFRFIHSQMSSNPPSVVMRPQSSDQEDHRRADAADHIVRYSIRHYNMQERVDQLSMYALLYGTGIAKTVWDSCRGDIIEFDKEKDEMKLEGDIAVTIPFTWNIYIDPDAKGIDEIRYIIERVYIDYEEACLRWPDKIDLLKKAKIERRGGISSSGRDAKDSGLQNDHYDCVELLEYWETGLPTNGYLGRYCLTTVQGDVVEPCRPSPHRFRRSGAVAQIENSDLPDDIKERKIDNLPEQAELPYHILTDIDTPNSVWGKSMVEYAKQLQDNLNSIDAAWLDNVRAHGVARLIVPESADISDDGMSDSPWDVTKISGNQPPYFMAPPQIMPDMTTVRVNHVNGINDVMGVNESMFGQQTREQAATAMQYATNQGNMIRRRLFNKYTLVVESLYKAILNLVRKHWTTERTIHVLGKEKALEAIDIKGSDIDGGYDIVGEYGAALSLDPITRRQEILTMQPLFEKAGVPARTALKMMKLSELEGMYDKLDLAGNRQKEIFDTMIATGAYVPPKKYRDHANMIGWALDYFMTSEYEMLPDNIQMLCEKHVEDRAQLAAQESQGPQAAPAAQTPPPPPGPVPAQPAGPVPAPATQPPIATGVQQ